MPDSHASTESRRSFFDALAPRRARDARLHGEFYADRKRWLRGIIPENMSVIDIGCGIGTNLSTLPNARKTGLDLSPVMIQLAKERDATSAYLVDDAEQLEHREIYDYVLLLETLNFLRDAQVALEHIRRNLCTDRTRIVITAFNFLWFPAFRLAEILGWKSRFPAQNWLSSFDIANLLSMADCEIVERGGRVLCPMYIPLLSTFLNRYVASLPFFRHLCMVHTVIARPLSQARTEYSVTVLSAVRNERDNVRHIADAMPAMGSGTELLFIEGHSTDGTWEAIETLMREQRPGIRIRGLKQPGKGKGDALHHGIRESTGQMLLVYDGDFTVHPSELPKLYDALATNKAEFVNGSRLMYPMQGRAMPIKNMMGNTLFSMLFSWLFGQKMMDVLSPVKGFYRSDYALMTDRMDPFGDFDLFLGIARGHRRMRETPVHYLERVYGTTKMRPFKHAWLLGTMFLKGARILKWL